MTEWVTVASVDDLPDGDMIGATVADVDVLVVNLGGQYRAIGAECTHEGCDLQDGELDPEDGVVTCACHGSMFDLETGEAVGPPADVAEPVYQVRVVGDDVQIAHRA